MKFRKIEWRNIFSYGNRIEELNFTDEGTLWEIHGKSGAGKSSLLQIPKLLLFGKATAANGEPLKMGNIANRINKAGWIRGEITNNSDTYVIERTFAPNTVKVFKNGENIDKAGSKDIQEVINTEILDGMSYSIFSNLMVLSLNNFKSFISMTPADKRQIVDKIFSLEIINTIHERIKTMMKETAGLINNQNGQISVLDQSIKNAQLQLENSQSAPAIDTDKVIKENTDKLTIIQKAITEQNDLYNKLKGDYQQITLTTIEFNKLYNNEITYCTNIQNQINLFNQDKCPTCGTSFSGERFSALKDDLQKSLNDHIELRDQYKNSIDEIAKNSSTITANINQVQTNITLLRQHESACISNINAAQAVSGVATDFTIVQQIITDNTDSKNSIMEKVRDNTVTINALNHLEPLYSAEGIKRQMMAKYIPTLNAEIQETLTRLDFPYMLKFDEGFDPHLESLGQSIDVQTLSAGEHKRVDLAVLCSILKMIKLKYPKINLICLDETLGSLDYDTSADVITYLGEVAKKMGLNIIIVSHAALDTNLFDLRIEVTKIGEYSEIKFI